MAILFHLKKMQTYSSEFKISCLESYLSFPVIPSSFWKALLNELKKWFQNDVRIVFTVFSVLFVYFVSLWRLHWVYSNLSLSNKGEIRSPQIIYSLETWLLQSTVKFKLICCRFVRQCRRRLVRLPNFTATCTNANIIGSSISHPAAAIAHNRKQSNEMELLMKFSDFLVYLM